MTEHDSVRRGTSFVSEDFLKYRDSQRKGFVILFDIIDSTKRKENHSWVGETQLFNNTVNNFFDHAITIIGDNGVKEEHCIKFMGDGCMLFLSLKPTCKTRELKSVAKDLFRKCCTLTSELQNSYREELNQMGIKTVITYAHKEALFIKSHHGTADYIGKDIDLAFRLEPHSGRTHLIANEEFVEHFADEKPSHGKSRSVTYMLDGYDCISCSKELKGLGIVKLYILSKISSMQENVIGSVIKSSDNIYLSLLHYVLDEYKKIEDALKNTKTELEDIKSKISNDGSLSTTQSNLTEAVMTIVNLPPTEGGETK